MSKHTSFKIGGPCDILINPESADELVEIIRDLKVRQTPYCVIGNGSNLLVSDEGVRGAVIEISKDMSAVEIISSDVDSDSDYVYIKAESGIMLSKLALFAYNEGLAGLEFASGIPGTLGGAVFMNAGAYQGEISQVLMETEYYDVLEDKIAVIDNSRHEFGYRHSIFQQNDGIILNCTLKLKKGTQEDIKFKMEDFSNRRKTKQPLEFASAGSTFKRPEGYFAGSLIENSGLAGRTIGGARVSEKHCGFIINTGGATCSDVLELIGTVKKEVYNKFGVELKEEVRIL